jgi:DNA-binding NtrC family response regulator
MSEKLSVLIIDDEVGMRRAIGRILSGAHHQTTTVGTGEGGLEEYRRRHFDLVLLDLGLPGKTGQEVLDELAAIERSLVIVVTGDDQLTTAVDCMRRGAFDFVPKRELHSRLLSAVERAVDKLRQERLFEASLRAESGKMGGMIGESEAMRQIFDLIARGAQSPDTTVMITGESGTGKELVAEEIHRKSPRKGNPFVPINCTAFPETLLESEFFGHKKGAFTGADKDKKGLFEVARGGTLFMDEVGDMPLSLQAKLLRFLENRTFRRLGGTRERHSDVRILAATNKNMKEMIKKGTFREDLFYRLDVFPIHLPPLCERPEDIPVLARHFLKVLTERYRIAPKQLSPAAAAALCHYPWPGNVRELRNVVERLLFMVDDQEIHPGNLPNEIRPRRVTPATSQAIPDLPYAEAKQAFLTRFNVTYVCQTMASCEGVVSQAARKAGMDRANWRRLMRHHGITSKNFSCHEPDEE